MLRIVTVILSVLLLSTLAEAQESQQPGTKAQIEELFRANLAYGNAFRGFPGALRNHSAILGFEYAPKALGAGFEWELRSICNHCEFRGSLSVNGYYHFLQLGGKAILEPFVTAGYSRAFRPYDTGLNILNYGGGVDLFGFVRLEVRDSLSFAGGVAHFPEFRTGLTLALWGGR